MIGGARFIRALPYVVAGVAAGYLYYVASNFQFHERPGTLGPDFWPEAILALMIVTCLYKIVSVLVARNDAAVLLKLNRSPAHGRPVLGSIRRGGRINRCGSTRSPCGGTAPSAGASAPPPGAW